LGHTARHADLQIGPRVFQRFQTAQFGIDLLRRLLANVAGVEQDHIRIIGPVGRDIALTAKALGHAFAVIDVHLATIGLDEQLFRLCHGGHPRVLTDFGQMASSNSGGRVLQWSRN